MRITRKRPWSTCPLPAGPRLLFLWLPFLHLFIRILISLYIKIYNYLFIYIYLNYSLCYIYIIFEICLRFDLRNLRNPRFVHALTDLHKFDPLFIFRYGARNRRQVQAWPQDRQRILRWNLSRCVLRTGCVWIKFFFCIFCDLRLRILVILCFSYSYWDVRNRCCENCKFWSFDWILRRLFLYFVDTFSDVS